MNHRGAVTSSLLMGLGSGLCFGVAIDATLMVLQGSGGPVPELIGSLGLPGAIMALAIAFFMGVKTFHALRQPQGGDSTLAAERRTNEAVEKIVVRLDMIAERLQENIDETRHRAVNSFAEVMASHELADQQRHRDLLVELRALEKDR